MAMIVRIYPLFATTHDGLMYILAKLQTGQCAKAEEVPRYGLAGRLLPCSCEPGIDLCQMPSRADIYRVVSTNIIMFSGGRVLPVTHAYFELLSLPESDWRYACHPAGRGRPRHWRVDRFVVLVTTIRGNQIARAIFSSIANAPSASLIRRSPYDKGSDLIWTFVATPHLSFVIPFSRAQYSSKRYHWWNIKPNERCNQEDHQTTLYLKTESNKKEATITVLAPLIMPLLHVEVLTPLLIVCEYRHAALGKLVLYKPSLHHSPYRATHVVVLAPFTFIRMGHQTKWMPRRVTFVPGGVYLPNHIHSGEVLGGLMGYSPFRDCSNCVGLDATRFDKIWARFLPDWDRIVAFFRSDAVYKEATRLSRDRVERPFLSFSYDGGLCQDVRRIAWWPTRSTEADRTASSASFLHEGIDEVSIATGDNNPRTLLTPGVDQIRWTITFVRTRKQTVLENVSASTVVPKSHPQWTALPGICPQSYPALLLALPVIVPSHLKGRKHEHDWYSSPTRRRRTRFARLGTLLQDPYAKPNTDLYSRQCLVAELAFGTLAIEKEQVLPVELENVNMEGP
ncbi:hypothetical protein EDD15DRAFT_2441616 [Pisolithus albus]|nr:hypothetical protein EDD15DRAFT_2441616 [Pisolithus albus]